MVTTNDMIRDLGSKLWPFLSIGDQDIQKAFGTLVKFLQDAKEAEKKARQELAKRNEEVYGEYRHAMEEKLRHSFISFSDKEREDYNNFCREHWNKGHKGKGMTIHLIGTGIGTCYLIECPVCHEQKDITDTESW